MSSHGAKEAEKGSQRLKKSNKDENIKTDGKGLDVCSDEVKDPSPSNGEKKGENSKYMTSDAHVISKTKSSEAELKELRKHLHRYKKQVEDMQKKHAKQLRNVISQKKRRNSKPKLKRISPPPPPISNPVGESFGLDGKKEGKEGGGADRERGGGGRNFRRIFRRISEIYRWRKGVRRSITSSSHRHQRVHRSRLVSNGLNPLYNIPKHWKQEEKQVKNKEEALILLQQTLFNEQKRLGVREEKLNRQMKLLEDFAERVKVMAINAKEIKWKAEEKLLEAERAYQEAINMREIVEENKRQQEIQRKFLAEQSLRIEKEKIQMMERRLYQDKRETEFRAKKFKGLSSPKVLAPPTSPVQILEEAKRSMQLQTAVLNAFDSDDSRPVSQDILESLELQLATTQRFIDIENSYIDDVHNKGIGRVMTL
ncbi:hypothetical protein AAMO2058_001615800 [Amorphochlora amoebiformis]